MKYFAIFGALLIGALIAVSLQAESSDFLTGVQFSTGTASLVPLNGESITMPQARLTIASGLGGLPREPAIVIAVTQCGKYVSLHVTARDGSVAVLDVDAVDAELVNEYLYSSHRAIEMPMDCNKVGHDSVR